MKIIDAHIHLSHIETFQHTAKHISDVDYSYKGLRKEMEQCDISLAIGMGIREIEGGEGFPDSLPRTPMGMDMMPASSDSVVYCAGVNPYRLQKQELLHLENELLKPEVVGIKIYLGYYPFYAHDKVYESVYKLAKLHRIPVIFHSGDTYSERGLLKYAHPLTLDEVAVKHREVTFVMAHFGDPWMLDAAEIIYKNSNMYADLSGLIVGDEEEVSRILRTPHYFDHFKHAFAYCDNYDKFMFGTDWPLVKIKPYIDFIQSYVPSSSWNDVFYNTACHVYPKIKQYLR
ncbi:amidohydrolase [Salipaludibacillus neizhouensis]|uniref:Amidohydrolase n=1 Tax=Salipaludibacillus neizhouensis TaxID=885475 RepID=A0A3A9KF34_9BACI|nr:amidohydrolase family protein [Salipaludibacillus neizhouensis]RKL69182.1 amidohydrolase [Salipaludibacillus neizhouensis]